MCAVHLPPYVTFEASAYQNGNFILHRGESLDSAFGTIRLYLLGRVFQVRCSRTKLPHLVCVFLFA